MLAFAHWTMNDKLAIQDQNPSLYTDIILVCLGETSVMNVIKKLNIRDMASFPVKEKKICTIYWNLLSSLWEVVNHSLYHIGNPVLALMDWLLLSCQQAVSKLHSRQAFGSAKSQKSIQQKLKEKVHNFMPCRCLCCRFL